ncbi:MAG TPA: Crp/Fnr family transcriptional regulator, partial [Deinococcales bacterium]|nr:Crp/Fnr family transcriptional regulator [Deinococcales bacterium]
DDAETLAIIAAGQVKLLRHGAEGRDVLLRMAGPGDLIGTFSALNSSHPESAQAHTDVCLLNITAGDFADLLRTHPEVTLAVLAFSTEQLTEARTAIRGLSTEPVETRLARTLLQLADAHGEPDPGGTVIQMPLPQQDLAALAGTTVETVSRILSRFRRDGLTDSGRRWVALRDRSALERLLND